MSTDPACWSWELPEDIEGRYERGVLQDWQGGRCAVCGETKPLVEDHEHDTKLTRGYLCRSCNVRECRRGGPVFDLYREYPPATILGLRVRYGSHTSTPVGRCCSVALSPETCRWHKKAV